MANILELARSFNDFCSKVHPVLPQLAEKALSGAEYTLSVPVYTIQLDEPAVWWNDQNLKDYADQLEALWNDDPESYNSTLVKAFEQIHENPQHAEQFEIVRRWVDQTKQDDMYFKRLLPHRIGIVDSNYGLAMYEQTAYQDMKMSLEVLGLNTGLHYTIDPTCPDLSRAFHLCVNISTKDKTPIKPKIYEGRLKGLFAKMPLNVRFS